MKEYVDWEIETVIEELSEKAKAEGFVLNASRKDRGVEKLVAPHERMTSWIATEIIRQYQRQLKESQDEILDMKEQILALQIKLKEAPEIVPEKPKKKTAADKKAEAAAKFKDLMQHIAKEDTSNNFFNIPDENAGEL
jgi:Fe2+ transport system protein B